MTADVHQLLATADRLLVGAPDASAVGRYRGAAFALRTALEAVVADVLYQASPPIRNGSTRAKFLCLRSFVDAGVARRAKAIWALLCLGCHYHQYELGPTRDQLRLWRVEVGIVISLLSASDRGPS